MKKFKRSKFDNYRATKKSLRLGKGSLLAIIQAIIKEIERESFKIFGGYNSLWKLIKS